MKVAILDVGSNSVRLMMLSDGKILYKTLNTCRLGEKIAFNGYLLPQAIERGVQAIDEFTKRAKGEGADRVYAFATAAVRSASNGEEFVHAVKSHCGVEVEVIAGEEEAEIGLSGALGANDGAILDVGGASSELILRRNGSIVYEKSVNVGAVRLFDLCGNDRERLEKRIAEEILDYGEVSCDLPLYGIGGTATSLAAVKLGLKEYDAERVNGSIITIGEMADIAARLTSLTPAEISLRYCVGEKRAEIVGGGALLIYRIMEKIGVSSLIVSESDNLEGYAKKKGLL